MASKDLNDKPDAKDEKEAIDALESEAKEFEKVSCLMPLTHRESHLSADPKLLGCRDRPDIESFPPRRVHFHLE